MNVNTFAQPVRNVIQYCFKRSGREVIRSPLMNYFRDFRIDCILDVGANTGQYAQEARSLGYRGRIESFEPQPLAYAALHQATQRDSLWNAHDYALGEFDTTASINLSAHSPSSSFLPLANVDRQLDMTYLSQQAVPVKRLDGIYKDVVKDAKNIFLKVDTQGFEREVLRGAGERLGDLVGIQLEVSLVPQYEGEALIEEHIAYLRARNFVPYWCIPGFRNTRTLQFYQVDIVFFNTLKVADGKS